MANWLKANPRSVLHAKPARFWFDMLHWSAKNAEHSAALYAQCIGPVFSQPLCLFLLSDSPVLNKSQHWCWWLTSFVREKKSLKAQKWKHGDLRIVICVFALFFLPARTTSPISPTETYKPSVRAPFWCSRVTTPVTLSGWATRRRPRCGTTTR